MDYSGIVNLALVTIIYSTFIAPNLKRLSDIRSEISDLDFPARPRSVNVAESEREEYDKHIQTNTEVLRKKFSQYGLIYKETRLFLKIFYITLAVVFGIQIWLMYIKGTLDLESVLYLVMTVAVIALLAISLRIFMVPRGKIRSIKWLYDVGIPEVHSLNMYSPTVWIGHESINVKRTSGVVRIELASKIRFYGNQLILTVESVDGKSMYAVVSGRISTRAGGGSSDFTSGERLHLVDLLDKVMLKPGSYKARLYVFGSIYGGTNNPTEVIMPFTIDDNGTKSNMYPVNLTEYSDEVTYAAGRKSKIQKVDFTNDLKKSDRLKELFATKQFIKAFKSERHFTQVTDMNGTLTKVQFEKKYSWKNRTAKSVWRVLGNLTWRRGEKQDNTRL